MNQPVFKLRFIGEFEHSRSPRALAGVQGAKPPAQKSEGGRCRRGERPLTRTGRCKKVVVSQGDLGKSLGWYVSRYSQFSCGFRRASGRFPTSRTTDKCCFSGICRPQQVASNICLLSCCGCRPRHRRPLGRCRGCAPAPRLTATQRADKPKFEESLLES